MLKEVGALNIRFTIYTWQKELKLTTQAIIPNYQYLPLKSKKVF